MTLEDLFNELNSLDCRIVSLVQRNQRYTIKLLCLKTNKIYNDSRSNIVELMNSVVGKVKKDFPKQ